MMTVLGVAIGVFGAAHFLPTIIACARLLKKEIGGLRYSEHVAGNGPQFQAQACKLGLEGAISKLADRLYAPGAAGSG